MFSYNSSIPPKDTRLWSTKKSKLMSSVPWQEKVSHDLSLTGTSQHVPVLPNASEQSTLHLKKR